MTAGHRRCRTRQVVPRPVRPLDERPSFRAEVMAMTTTDLPKAYTPRDVEGASTSAGWRRIFSRPMAPDRPPIPTCRRSRRSSSRRTSPDRSILAMPQRTAVEDLMIRHARMRGHPTLFLPGLDHRASRPSSSSTASWRRRARVASRWDATAISSGCAAFVAETRDHARPAATGRGVGGLGPVPLHDGRGLGTRPSAWPSSASTGTTLPIAPKRS